MSEIYKFGQPDDEVFTWPNIYGLEHTRGPERLAIAPREQHIELMLDLTAIMPAPFSLLYVLVNSSGAHQVGRYQTPEPVRRDEMEQCLVDFREFFENDARHHIWVMSAEDEDQVIYDNHNLLYAYGRLREFEDIATSWGLREADVELPSPHTHCCHPVFDPDEKKLMARYPWVRYPLSSEDVP